MPIQLQVRDETPTGQSTHELTLDFLTERITVRELIRSRVYQEVKDHNLRAAQARTEANVYHGLVRPVDAEQVLNGYKVRGNRQLDWQQQFEVALAAFARNGFLILVDDRQSREPRRGNRHPPGDAGFIRETGAAGGGMMSEKDGRSADARERAIGLLERFDAEVRERAPWRHQVADLPAGRAILDAEPTIQVEVIRYTLGQVAAVAQMLAELDFESYRWSVLRHTPGFPDAAAVLCALLLQRELPLEHDDVRYFAERTADIRVITTFTVPHAQALVDCITRFVKHRGLTDELKTALYRLADALHWVSKAPERKLMTRLQRLAGGPRQLPLQSGEPWAEAACRAVEADEWRREAWVRLLDHCLDATAGTPSRKWLDAAQGFLGRIGHAEFKERVCAWFPLVNEPRSAFPVTDRRWEPQPEWGITEPNANALKGLAWCCGLQPDAELARALGALALSSYRKLPGIGPRLVRVGNACIWALGAMPGRDGLGQLVLLKVRVKFGTAQRLIEKALTAAAERLGLPRDEIEELAVPTYGLEEVGLRHETLGDYTAELAITGTSSTELRWRKTDGRRRRNPCRPPSRPTSPTT